MNQQSKNAIDTLLEESLKELAVTRPIEKITIKEITDKAGVIRPTFYNHFQDKYELLEWIVKTELFDPMMPLLSSGMLREGVLIALKKVEEDKEFYIRAVRLEGQNSFADILRENIRDFILHFLNLHLTDRKALYEWLTPERISDYYASALTIVIVQWIEDGMQIPDTEFVDTLLYLFTHTVLEVLGGKP